MIIEYLKSDHSKVPRSIGSLSRKAMQENTKFVIVEKGTNPTLVLDSGNGSVLPVKPKISKTA